MKPGCFLKSIIVITILVAGIMYIIQYKTGLFFEPGKKIVAGLITDSWNDEFKYVKNTPEKIKLKQMLDTYIRKLKYEDTPGDKELNEIVDLIKAAAKDSAISSSELEGISKKLKIKYNYERPE